MSSSNGELKPLKLSCTKTDCGNGLHCFQRSKKLAKAGQSGTCRECGAGLVDWPRVHRRDSGDASYLVAALQFEWIRHRYWHIPLTEYASNYARRKGRTLLKEAVRRQIENAVGKPNHPKQGRQTPWETNPKATAVHYAQHATASCCRKCVEEWHAIPADVDLSAEQLDYLTDLAMRYIIERIRDLSDQPVAVPRRSAARAIDSALPAPNRLPYAS
jgi:hypothetical protein